MSIIIDVGTGTSGKVMSEWLLTEFASTSRNTFRRMTHLHTKPSTARVEIPGRAARSGGDIGLGDAVPGWRDEEGRDARHDREAASWKDGDADIERSRGQGGAHPDAETRARVRGTRGGARQGGDPGRPRGRDPGFAASPRRRRGDARGGGPETPQTRPRRARRRAPRDGTSRGARQVRGGARRRAPTPPRAAPARHPRGGPGQAREHPRVPRLRLHDEAMALLGPGLRPAPRDAPQTSPPTRPSRRASRRRRVPRRGSRR